MAESIWWQSTTIYQIYPRSYYDSNGDGIGDIQGIIEKLDYLKNLGFETIWCSPFFASEQKDFGYDITHYEDIAPEYGTLKDALQLIDEVHKRNMKIVFDMVMNHTSDKHPWFLESCSSRNNPKSDWYIWTDKPNNWRSMTGGSSWQYCEARKQYYLATFLPFQPDLNYRNPDVKKQILAHAEFWLKHEVDGFRLDIFNVIYKDEKLRSNPFSTQLIPDEENPFGHFQTPVYNLNQSETIEFAKELRKLTQQYGEKMLIGEVTGNISTIKKYLGENENNGLGLVFNFEMLRFKFNAEFFRNLIKKMEAHFSHPFMPVYVFSNHDRRRAATRLKGDVEKLKLLIALQLTVRGVPCVYYGEEIGMTDYKLPYSKALDPIPHLNKWIPRFLTELADETINRDDFRTPMQWSNSANAGFSEAKNTWLPVHPDYSNKNVEQQENDSNSLLNITSKLLKIRKQFKSLSSGSLRFEAELNTNELLCFSRIFEDEKTLLIFNFSNKMIKLPAELKESEIIFSTKNTDSTEILGYGCLIISQ